MSSVSEEGGDDRLERLERETERLNGLLKKARSEVRALQWLVAGAVVLTAGAGVYLHEAGILKLKGKEPEKTVESQEFGLYNRKGDRVMLTDYDKFGYPNLVFLDLKKQYRMGVKVWPEGGGTPGMVFYDDTGIRGNWRMDENNATVLNLMGRGKAGRITLAVSADGEPSFTVMDKQGKILFEIPKDAANSQSASSRPDVGEQARTGR